MTDVLRKMIEIYKITDKDWMNFSISIENYLTYHHIDKKENGGLEDIKNGTILTKKAHDLLHMIEKRNNQIYIQINELLKEINNSNNLLDTSKKEQIVELIYKYINMGYPLPKKMKAKSLEKLLKK